MGKLFSNKPLEYKEYLIVFIKEIFEKNFPFKSQELIDKINKYLNTNGIRLSRSYFFTLLKNFQMKILIDITKGLDPLYCDFFCDNEFMTKLKKGGICRAHIDEDTDYKFICQIFSDEGEYYYRFKLAPLRFLTSHHDTHSYDFPTGLANNLIEARMRHLNRLKEISYNQNLSFENYISIFKKEFYTKKDFIFQYNEDINIWDSFYDERTEKTISGLSDKILIEFVKRWIDFKLNNELCWYNKYYKDF